MKVALLAVLAALVLAGGARAEPPAGLAEQGRLYWELEALFHDRFGARSVCLDLRRADFSPKACKLPAPYRGFYESIFADARGSSLRLVKRSKAPMAHPVALRVAGRYVACGPGQWLVSGHGGVGLALGCL